MRERREQAGATTNLRLFIAIELPREVRDALGEAIVDLQRAGANAGLRWVRPDAMHLTLKFLGATPPDRVPAIIDALRAAAGGAGPFDLRPAGYGSFHGGRHMPHEFRGSRETYHYNLRVLWVGVDGATEELAALAERIETAVNPLGYRRERTPFFPHLTLARVRDDADRETRIALWRALEPYLSRGTRTGTFRPELVRGVPAFHVEQIALIASKLRAGGAQYETIETVALR